MADTFQPKFVDLVRNYTTTVGTADFVLGPAVNGFSGFTAACAVGDNFYYAALGVDKPAEREVGRGTLMSGGVIKRSPISGTKTNFTSGTKSLALIAAAEWFADAQALVASVGAAGQSLVSAATPAGARAALTLGGASLLDSDADANLSANSDTRVPTQKAVKAYVDAQATSAGGTALIASNNLSDVASASSARTNLGITGAFAAIAADRTALASLATSQAGVYLKEVGREGVFVWSGANLSAPVAADSRQGLYVAPASDTSGASGAWARKFTGPADFRWFGAVADCTAAGSGTSNTAVLDSARAALVGAGRGWLHIPQQAAAYRFATAPAEIHDGIAISGEGWHENSGTVGVVTYVGIQKYPGTVLCFDADVAGLNFVGATDNASNNIVEEYQSSSGSVLRDIMLYSAGGVGTTNHGISNYTNLELHNVRVIGFAGCGVFTAGDDSGTTSQYGNTANSVYDKVTVESCKLHGFYTEGNNSSVIRFAGCSAASNGGVGYLDRGFFGNAYFCSHAANNNASSGTPAGFSAAQRAKVVADWAGLSDPLAGSYVTNSAVAAHVFSGCYVEPGNGAKAETVTPSQVIGGQLASPANHTAGSTGRRDNGNGLVNVDSITPLSGILQLLTGQVTLNNTAGNTKLLLTGAGIGWLQLAPGGSVAAGWDVQAGGGGVYHSADSHIFRNAAISVTYGTIDNSGFNLATGALKIGGTTVISNAGVLQAAATPAFTGDVTKAAGALATTIAANSVTFSKFVAATGPGVVGASSAGNFGQLGFAGGLGVAGSSLTINGPINAASSVSIGGGITSSGGGMGYATGAGGTVTQATGKSTGVTLNKLCGQITMNAAALAASTTVSFVLTDSFIAAGDLLILNHVSGGTVGSYALNPQCGAGTATINVRNISAASLSEAIVISFAVHKGVTA